MEVVRKTGTIAIVSYSSLINWNDEDNVIACELMNVDSLLDHCP